MGDFENLRVGWKDGALEAEYVGVGVEFRTVIPVNCDRSREDALRYLARRVVDNGILFNANLRSLLGAGYGVLSKEERDFLIKSLSRFELSDLFEEDI